MNYGFWGDIILPTDYIQGWFKIPSEVLCENGQWDEWLPSVELQRRNDIETAACVRYTTLNAIEILQKRKYGIIADYSERYTSILTGDNIKGTTPNKVADAIRKKGLISEYLLPFDDSVHNRKEYFSPSPLPNNLTEIGTGWIKKWDFRHEWVFKPNYDDKIERLKTALKFSPVGIGVQAWTEGDGDGEGVYFRNGQDNHFTLLYGYEDNDYQQYWKVFDTYDNTHKALVWEYGFQWAKRYWIGLKNDSLFSRWLLQIMC